MLRRNIDFLAIAIAFFGMSMVRHIPPPDTAIKVIRYQAAAQHAGQYEGCPLLQRLFKCSKTSVTP
ncbi:MAG: hypothetical protein ACR2NN_01875 [Bryobacteraceae bacterium]